MFVLAYKLSTNYVDSFPYIIPAANTLSVALHLQPVTDPGEPIRPCPGPPPPQIGVATTGARNSVTYRLTSFDTSNKIM